MHKVAELVRLIKIVILILTAFRVDEPFQLI